MFVAALDSKIMEVQRRVMGTEIRSADPTTKEDQGALWNKGIININTAQGLLNGVYFYNSKEFGLRACGNR